jgi:hypothetical protein
MSTRANVLIKSVGLDYKEPYVLLYHHYDGYPEYMIPTMLNYEKIFKNEVKKVFKSNWENEKWMFGRALHLASLIVATDPLVFEVDAIFEKEEDIVLEDIVLHGDIDYYYVITAKNYQRGVIDEVPQIWIEIYTTRDLDEKTLDQFWETGDPKLLRQILAPTPFTPKEMKKVLKNLD